MRKQLRTRLLCGVAVLALITASCTSGEVSPPYTTAGVVDTTSSTDSRPAEGNIPVVFDGDFGPDDMMALLYLLQAPGIDLMAVTVSGTGLVHCPQGASNAAAILEYAGHEEIPVACGQSNPTAGTNAFPEEWRAGADQLAEDLGVAMIPGAVDGDAVGLLVETIESADQPVHLLVAGPMANIAAALDLRPQIVDNLAGIVAMGGALEVNGSVAPAYTAEWNLWVDPVAANSVLQSGVPVQLVPLDATNDVPATIFFYEALESARSTPAADLVYEFFTRNDYNLEGGSYFFWDPLAAVSIVLPEVLTTEVRSVAVVEEPSDRTGALIETPDGAEVRVALSADRRMFEETFLSTLDGGIPISVDIPIPEATVRYTGQTCTFDGQSEFVAQGSLERVVVEVINETEMPVTVVSGLHDGVAWEQVQADAAEYEQTGQPPAYWQQTGTVSLYGRSLTGGRTVAALDLVPGTHALVCGSDDGHLFPLTDLVILEPTAS
jgi:inosine-uridine nucleoside N-ribohydrolase